MKNIRESKNYVYEVEVSNNSHDEEFALELFEMIEDPSQVRPLKKLHSFDELVQWNEEHDVE